MDAFIQESRRIIKKAIDNKKLLIFVGAGVSANSGLPSWAELINQFNKGLENNKTIKEDDFLKIPQLYYNSRGHKEYYDLLKGIFNVPAKPNAIHDILSELNPNHFVTTNYDCLIEDSMRAKENFYGVVSKDEDLPYTDTSNLIIKMHGEISNKNIVLKEDDYLSYSTNFKLIENYVKALLSTHIVLLVGYSLNDNNVKMIFQWVKDILKTHFQPAYFLDIDSEKSDISEFDYHKNRGINILYYSKINKNGLFDKSDTPITLTHKKGKAIYNFLNYIKEGESITDKKENFNYEIDYIYNKLLNLNQLNKLLIEEIMLPLGMRKKYKKINNKLIIYSGKFELLLDQIEANDMTEKYQLSTIINILFKADIFEIITNFNGKERTLKLPKTSKDADQIEFEKMLIECDYISMKNWIDNDLDDFIISGNEMNYLRKGYLLWKTGNVEASYRIHKRISEFSFQKQNYILYFISQFNKKNVGDFIYLGAEKEAIQKKIRKETEEINLEMIYKEIGFENSNIFIRKLFDFDYIYFKSNHMRILSEKIDKENDTVFYGGVETASIYQLENEIKFFWEYITQNCLILEDYTEVQEIYNQYAKTILNNLSVNKNEFDLLSLEFDRNNAQIAKLENVSYFSIFIIANYADEKIIKNLIGNLDGNTIPMIDKDIKKIIKAFSNLIKAHKLLKATNNSMKIENVINNFLIILGKLNLKKEDFDIILNLLLESDSIKIERTKIKIFIYYQYKFYSKNIEFKVIDKSINKLLIYQILENVDGISFEVINLIKFLVEIIISLDKEYILNDQNILEFVIKNEKFNNNLMGSECLISLYKLCNFSNKKIIKSIITKNLESTFNIDLFSSALLQNIIDTSKFKSKYLRKVEDIFQDSENTGLSIMGETTNLEKIENQIINILLKDLLKEIDFNKYIGKSKKLDLFLDPKNFNYENFQLEWIEEFPEFVHAKLVNIPETKVAIKALFEQLIISKNLDKKVKEIFFKYYL